VKTVCIGAGPAGQYFSILTKLRDPAGEVTVVERNPGGVTYGFGVTFSADVLDCLYSNDPVSAARIEDSPASWNDQLVQVCDRPGAHLGGYGFALGRQRMLDILTERALELGVKIEFERTVTDLSEFSDADLIVACDGANSRVRQSHARHFRTTVHAGRNKYVWLGTDKAFDEFVYGFEQTGAGWIWFYAYPFDAHMTTFIVECTPETWTGLGFDRLGPDGCRAALESIFARHLDGHSLITQSGTMCHSPWLNFTWITNESWHHDNVVLMGDAAHTTHYSIGSGTKLAIEDAVALNQQLGRHPDLATALCAYERERSVQVGASQRAARASAAWFENLERHLHPDPVRFAYSLRTRSRPTTEAPGGVPWFLHCATQLSAGRRARRWVSMARSGGWAGRGAGR
jgi:anthraniloyl-CoA monooxygenase